MATRPEKRNPLPKAAQMRPSKQPIKRRPCDEQEEEGARIMRGEKTRGSGCGNDKGDVKNWFARCESKTTGKGSLSIKMEWLCKISREARDDGKLPLFQFGFDEMPRGFSSDWFSVPAETFDIICGILHAVNCKDFEEAEKWLRRLI